ncbi:glycerophosphodiester phosphodiesterase family protein [Herbiconiux sp. KACC 21604]|uniref:glycerophosphodiester phosphodiesterase family protein n=1 Tax=unclassified Herbiconiux TaxID=2618217 RepID=UPI0014930385|nr:glycerophosphodiester phosphodiesterase family protein [Herbiconiux sp. SALV-R1]QJU53505.1 glycerophosphodiester phosphodiesterase [Herbiconiux sp. SALV-R1]WPO88481.1 glycerophosphodiester phosphodiesterase family protein [Herbiconiux sp. KACC 21604]
MRPRARAERARRPYFAPPAPRVLAHRGLAVHAVENTLDAFRAAIDAGALYLETDVNASADGVAVVCHDPTLERIAGRADRVDQLTLAELQRIDLGGGARFPTLLEALEAFPEARFNIDIKSPEVAGPAARAVLAAGATDRVLVTSFSTRRRLAALRLLPGAASSASAPGFVAALLLIKVGLPPLARLLLRGVDAVQIPLEVGPLATTTARTVRGFHRTGVEVHVWTINDVALARELLDRGVDGIVSDRADLVLELVAERSVSPEGGSSQFR